MIQLLDTKCSVFTIDFLVLWDVLFSDLINMSKYSKVNIYIQYNL